MEEFHRKIDAPIVKSLLEEIHAAFDMSSIDPIGALYMVEPIDIPTENVTGHCNVKLEILFNFDGKPLQDSYESQYCCQSSPDKLYSGIQNRQKEPSNSK